MTGQEVIEIRKKLGVTQQRLADLCGCSLRTLQRWEEKGASAQNERILQLMLIPVVKKAADSIMKP